MDGLPGEVPALIEEFISGHVRDVGLPLLLSLRIRAIRSRAWFRLSPIRRGLLEAAIAYMRRGFKFTSSHALALLRGAVVEALTLLLTRSVRFVAYVIGSRLAGRLAPAGVMRVAEVIVLGLQWLNTPTIYRAGIA